jgi:hypothetical protein
MDCALRCVAGGGYYVNHTIHPTNGTFFDKGMHEGKGYFYNALDCQTFWTSTDAPGEYCNEATKIDRDCVTNYRWVGVILLSRWGGWVGGWVCRGTATTIPALPVIGRRLQAQDMYLPT